MTATTPSKLVRVPFLQLHKMLWLSMATWFLSCVGYGYQFVPEWAVAILVTPMVAFMGLIAWAKIKAIRQNRWDILCPWEIVGMTEDEANEFALHVNNGVPLEEAMERFISVHRKSVLHL